MMDRRTALKGAFALGGALAAGRPAWAQPVGPLKVGSVKFGALGWLLETIKAEGIDKALGLEIATVELSNNQAGPISLLSGGSDVIVSDWPWALRQRGLGEPLKFAPYSSALGGMMVPAASPARSLTDLAGLRIGVAGSGIDKSWLLLQAYSRKKLGFDIASKATVQFGAAPLLAEQLRDGKLDAALNFWTQNVRLAAVGLREIVSMKTVIGDLGVDPVPSFVGFIWKEQTGAAKGAEIAAFLKAVQQGNRVLATPGAAGDAAWARVKDMMKVASDAEFTGLRAAYVDGAAAAWAPAQTASAEKVMGLLVEAGDTELVGANTKFDPKLFHVANV